MSTISFEDVNVVFGIRFDSTSGWMPIVRKHVSAAFVPCLILLPQTMSLTGVRRYGQPLGQLFHQTPVWNVLFSSPDLFGTWLGPASGGSEGQTAMRPGGLTEREHLTQ